MSSIVDVRQTGAPPFTTWEVLYYEIRARLEDGRLETGQILSLRDLAGEFGVSTAPVRVALHKLVASRLVEQIKGGRFRIVGATPSQRQGFRILRRALECEAARLAAERISDGEIEELRALAREADALFGKREARSSACHINVHLRIAEIAGCPELLEDIKDRGLTDLAGAIGYSTPVTEPDSHATLVEALSSRDPDGAYHVMRRHLSL